MALFSFNTLKKRGGFTLIELLVVIAMIGVLFLGLIFSLNPVSQYKKAQDSQREHDLQQIKQALDTYYNDTKCYPAALSSLGTQYLQKLPVDPSGASYAYQTDGSTCPQWNVLYDALQSSAIPQNACPLTSQTSCLPKNYTTEHYNFCMPSGEVDCASIASGTIGSSGTGTGTGGSGGGGGITITPTPTPAGITCPNKNYVACTGANKCNSIGLVNGVPTQCYGYGGTYQCYCGSCSANGVVYCN